MPIIINHSTSHNLYKVSLNNSSNNLLIIFSQTMTAGTSKSATNLSVWHQRFAHLNKTSNQHLVDITSGMIITFSFNKLLFRGIYIEAKIKRQQYQQPCLYSITAGFHLYADVRGERDIYAIFYDFQ